MITPSQATQAVRAAALACAVHRHADVPSWEQGGTDVVLATAERFAAWIEGEPHARNSSGEVPAWLVAAPRTPSGYADTRETPQGRVAADEGAGQ